MIWMLRMKSLCSKSFISGRKSDFLSLCMDIFSLIEEGMRVWGELMR